MYTVCCEFCVLCFLYSSFSLPIHRYCSLEFHGNHSMPLQNKQRYLSPGAKTWLDGRWHKTGSYQTHDENFPALIFLSLSLSISLSLSPLSALFITQLVTWTSSISPFLRSSIKFHGCLMHTLVEELKHAPETQVCKNGEVFGKRRDERLPVTHLFIKMNDYATCHLRT